MSVKELNLSLLCLRGFRGSFNEATVMPRERDVSLSDSCTPDLCSNFIRAEINPPSPLPHKKEVNVGVSKKYLPFVSHYMREKRFGSKARSDPRYLIIQEIILITSF